MLLYKMMIAKYCTYYVHDVLQAHIVIIKLT